MSNVRLPGRPPWPPTETDVVAGRADACAVDVEDVEVARARRPAPRGRRPRTVANPVADAGRGPGWRGRRRGQDWPSSVVPVRNLLRAAVVAGVGVDGGDRHAVGRGRGHDDGRLPSVAADLGDGPARPDRRRGLPQPLALRRGHPALVAGPPRPRSSSGRARGRDATVGGHEGRRCDRVRSAQRGPGRPGRRGGGLLGGLDGGDRPRPVPPAAPSRPTHHGGDSSSAPRSRSRSPGTPCSSPTPAGTCRDSPAAGSSSAWAARSSLTSRSRFLDAVEPPRRPACGRWSSPIRVDLGLAG